MSVLLSYRDAALTLEECLSSVRAQDMEDFEVLAVDDGSSDFGPSMVRALADTDQRIRAMRHPGDGIVGALNYGLRAARAPLVARMDADDRMHPHRLGAALHFMRTHPRVALVASKVEAFPGQDLTAGMREYLRWQDSCMEPRDIRDEIYVESPFVHPSVTFRRDLVQGIGGYRQGPYPEDYDLWLRLVAHGAALAKLPQRLLHWRVHEASLSRTDPRYCREAFDELRSRYLARDPRLTSDRPLAIWGAGRRTRQRAARLLAKGIAPCAWIDIDPKKVGNRVGGIPVVAPQWLAAPLGERPFVLGYVASHGARDAIAAALQAMGYRRGMDYLMVG